ncbi:MAG TPA: hypothetical protein VNV44_09995 [Solirubrobacteraceae bacterium]|jgi:hypothetical protein|nr:hypothetical protein [Solirubrobacteraceae bacterium]
MPRLGERRYAVVATGFAVVLLLLAGLLWFRPYITEQRRPVTGVPTPPALFALDELAVGRGSSACMSPITIEPGTGYAQFDLRPSKVGQTGPPVEVVLSAPGFKAVAHVPGGYPGGSVALPVASPSRTVNGTVCFINRGHTTVLLDGTNEPRTVAARTATTIGGRPVVGDVALTFLAAKTSSPLDELGRVFGHASNLTDRLIPVWLIWVIALLCAIGVPLGVLGALYLSLRPEEPARSAPA